jgi:WD40-like Beta Propeller Repeat
MSWEDAQRPTNLRRWLLIGAAVVAAAGALVVAVTGRAPDGTLAVRPAASPQPTSPATGSEPSASREQPSAEAVAASMGSGSLLPDGATFAIIAAGQTGWREIDVATGAVTRWRMAGAGAQGLSRTLFLSGDDLIMTLGLGPADIVRVAPDGQTVRIARRRQAIPTIDGGSVWVHDGLSDDFGGAASLVDPDGSVRERIELPSLTRPAVGTSAGLLVTTESGTAVVSDAGSRPIWRGGTVAAADATRVAHVTCDPAPSCEILIGTLDQPDAHRLRLAPGDVPGGAFGPGLGAFSADGRWLALPVFTQSARNYVSIIDTATGVEVGRPEGSDQPFSSALAWSPDSRWLVFASGDGIAAWDTTRRRAAQLDVELREPTNALAVR